jgi:hypothetical protein
MIDPADLPRRTGYGPLEPEPQEEYPEAAKELIGVIAELYEHNESRPEQPVAERLQTAFAPLPWKATYSSYIAPGQKRLRKT